jgi:osmotically-inducible protein OsmY
MTLKFYLGTGLLVASTVLAGCGDSSTNVSVNANRGNNAMTNLGTNNASSNAVVVNSNSNAGANRWNNANVSREEYNKNKGDYEKEKGASTIGTGANDSWLWFKTRAALLTTSDLRESTINVDVVNDVITLKGTVANAAQKTKAEQVANGIDGKKKVVNELKVAANDSMTNTSGGSDNSHSNTNGKK